MSDILFKELAQNYLTGIVNGQAEALQEVFSENCRIALVTPKKQTQAEKSRYDQPSEREDFTPADFIKKVTLLSAQSDDAFDIGAPEIVEITLNNEFATVRATHIVSDKRVCGDEPSLHRHMVMMHFDDSNPTAPKIKQVDHLMLYPKPVSAHV